MGDIANASLSGIKNVLANTPTYHPMEANTFSNWATEAGDIVTIKRGDETYQTPIHSSRLVWRGTPEITLNSTGNKEREPLAKVSRNKYKRGSSGNRTSAGLGHRITETDEYWESHYWDLYNGLDGRITQTAAEWRAEYSDSYNGLRGYVSITAEHFQTLYEDQYNGLMGYVDSTAQHWESLLATTDGSLRTLVSQTASSWSAALDTATSSARIGVRLNELGSAGAFIDGDWVTIDSTTTVKISDVFVVDSTTPNPLIRMKLDSVRMGSSLNTLITFTNGDITAWGYKYNDPSDSQTHAMLMKAAVDGNTLKIWTFDDSANSPSITFSKATTLSPEWSGSIFPLEMVAYQRNGSSDTEVARKTVGFTNACDVFLQIDKNGTPTQFGTSKKLINVPYKVFQRQTVNGQAVDSNRYTGSIASVDATDVYNYGWNDARDAMVIPTTAIASTDIDGSKATVTIQKPNADGSSSKTNYDYTINLTDYNIPNTTTKVGVAEIKYSSNVVARKTITNLITANIKSGVTICGLAGTFTSDANATANQILKDKTAYVNGSKITGNIVTSTNSGTTITPGTSAKTAINGGHYASSNILVAGDANLAAGNIKSGVTIFGVTGAYSGAAQRHAIYVTPTSDHAGSYWWNANVTYSDGTTSLMQVDASINRGLYLPDGYGSGGGGGGGGGGSSTYNEAWEDGYASASEKVNLPTNKSILTESFTCVGPWGSLGGTTSVTYTLVKTNAHVYVKTNTNGFVAIIDI